MYKLTGCRTRTLLGTYKIAGLALSMSGYSIQKRILSRLRVIQYKLSEQV